MTSGTQGLELVRILEAASHSLSQNGSAVPFAQREPALAVNGNGNGNGHVVVKGRNGARNGVTALRAEKRQAA